jgi:phosphoribosylformylglycinamidine (FGAM) synthase PurS component
MTQINPDSITETISLTVLPHTNGQYICEMSTDLSECPTSDSRYYGQTKEHTIAIALEQLAARYRQIAEKRQNRDWDAVERTETGEPIPKSYHVILHYERIAEAESMFEAMHDTIIGNTVVENAEITLVEIADDLPIQPLTRWKA